MPQSHETRRRAVVAKDTGWKSRAPEAGRGVTWFVVVPGCYLACGALFARPFVVRGLPKIDPHAAHGSWGFRLAILPGVVAFWPLLLRRWAAGVDSPPAERTAHRRAARTHVAP